MMYYIALIVMHVMLHDIFSNHGYIILCLSACYVTNDTIYHVIPRSNMRQLFDQVIDYLIFIFLIFVYE